MDEIELETDKATMPEYHKGKGVKDVSARQARCTIKTYSGNALWFAESFGLIPKVLELEMKKSGHKKIICCNNDKENQCTADKSKDDKQNLLQILFLLDMFGVGDAFYCELSMAHPELPQFYHFKEARRDLDKSIPIRRIHSHLKVHIVLFWIH